MAADFNLTNQYISASFDNLMQNSGSIPVNGLGTQISNLTVTSSFATTASYALNAEAQVSASYANRAGVADAVSGSNVVGTVSDATNAINALGAETATKVNVKQTPTGSFNYMMGVESPINAGTPVVSLAKIKLDGSITDAMVTGSFKGDLDGNAATATTASFALNFNPSATASFATSASHAIIADSATTATTATTASYVVTAQTASYVAGANVDGTVATATSSSHAINSDNSISASHAVQANNATTATSASHAIIADSALSSTTATSASHALRADISDNVDSSARLNVTDITASNATFTSASIGYLRTVTGSATIIGDEYLILNADSPTKRFAGIKVYDSGSSLTGSFEWDSVDDNWIQVETGGTSAGMLTGISGSKGSEAYPSNNTILKGTGNHTVKDSSIVDNGVNVTTTLPISASGGIIGNLTGNASTATLATNATNAVSASHAVQADSALTANTATSASFATTASFALNTNVDSGSWDGQFSGSASITGSLIVSRSSGQALTSDGNFTANLFTPSAFSEHQIFTAPAFTKTAGVTETYNINQIVYQDFAFGAGHYENSWMVSQWDSSGFNYGMDLLMGATRINANVQASGSGTAAQRASAFSVLDDTPNHSGDQAGDAVARYYGRTMELGLYNSETIVLGNNLQSAAGYTTANTHITAEDQIIIGSAQGTAYPYKGFSREWNGTGKATKDINFYYTGSASFIQTGSATGPAVQITGSLNITGSDRNASTIAGNIKQSFPSPGNNNSVGLVELSGTNTIGGKDYTNKNFFVADFNTFGPQFQDYFSIEYYDSFAYNYGSEMNVNGLVSRFSSIASGSGAGRTSVIETRDNQDGTGRIRLLTGDQCDMRFDAGNKGISVTGAVKSNITALAIASTTASMDCQDGDMFTLTLVSGSDTRLETTNMQAGQTISVQVSQPTTATDSYGSLSYSGDFKFAGGTAPTMTERSGSLSVLTFQSFDGTKQLGTAVTDLY